MSLNVAVVCVLWVVDYDLGENISRLRCLILGS